MKTRFQSPFLQEKRVSRTDGFNTLSSKMIRWMIFDGRDLFWFSFAGKFLREPFCRVAPRPCTPGLLSFHEESNQRRAKEDVSSLETPLRGTSPRELCCAKLSPPVCSASGQILGCLPTTSDNRRLCRCKVLPKAKPLAHSRAAASKQLCCPCRFYFFILFLLWVFRTLRSATKGVALWKPTNFL